jgi:dTDP-4-dehydrorhamnose 3,5-epimerase
MQFIKTKLDGAYVIEIERREDSRGFFARAFCQKEFAAQGLKPIIAQANVAYNFRRGARGMHCSQRPRRSWCVAHGRNSDIIVDLRPESPTYLRTLPSS